MARTALWKRFLFRHGLKGYGQRNAMRALRAYAPDARAGRSRCHHSPMAQMIGTLMTPLGKPEEIAHASSLALRGLRWGAGHLEPEMMKP